MEAAKMSHYQGMYLKNMVFMLNTILFSHKKIEILSFAGKWMDLENIILN
jgi:hypothetical protein